MTNDRDDTTTDEEYKEPFQATFRKNVNGGELVPNI